MAEQIGRYRIEREIGRGGFGHVYLAYDPVMDRKVAVKVLTQLDDPSLIARFRTEAIAAGNLHHRNIVTIYDFGEDGPRHYLVMEYLDGSDLQHLMSSNEPLALWQKVDIMSQIAEGLYCAHQSGVVHRDVKPANVIVMRDGTVKILDFGIARLTERDATRLTRSGFLVGTVLYMSPDQLSDGSVDALSDIWSYGVMYYEILTGRHPFASGQDTGSVMYRIMNQDPERITSIAPECPEALERIVMRLLAKQRENRYQSLAELQYDALPVLRELKRQQAAGLLGQAASLVDDGRYDDAEPLIRSILDLDPGNGEGARLRERLGQARKRQLVRPKVDKLLETVETQAAARNYRAAIDALQKARALDPADASLPQRMEALRAKQQQSDMAQRCLSEARHQVELQNFTEAFKQATNAVNADPGAPEAAQLLDNIQRELAQRDRERNIQRAINRAKGLLVMEVFDEALELLRKAAEDYPGSERLEELLRQTQRQKADKEARERVAAGIAIARGLLKKRSFAEAIAGLEALQREFPADTELAGLLGFAREERASEERAAAVDRLIRDARTRAQNRDFEGAIRAIEEGLASSPGEESLLRMMQAVLAAKAEDEKARGLQETLGRARRLREQGAFQEALELCAAFERDHPGDPELARLREELQRDQRQAEERRLAAEREAAAQREISNLLAETMRRADGSDWAGALKTAEDGLRRYPTAAKLKEAADYMRRKKAEADSLQEIESACEEVRRGLAAGQLDAAAKRLAQARRQCQPDARFDAIEKELQQATFRQEHFRAAQDKIRDGSLAEAERELRAILDRDSRDLPARDLLEKLHRQRTADERKQKYDAGRAEAGRLLRERQFDDAVRALETLLADFPADPLVQEELRVAREARERAARGETVARGRVAADELLRAKNFAKAIWLLEELQKRFPEEPIIAEDLKSAHAAAEDYERKQAYAAGRDEAERLLAARDFPGAIAQYQSLEQQFPNDPFLQDALKAALAAQELHLRKKEAGEGRAEAQRLLRERKVPEAIALLQTLIQKFPEDLALADLLRTAQETQRAAQETQRNRALIAGRAEAERLMAARDFPGAIAQYQSLGRQFPNDPSWQDALKAAQAAQEQHLREKEAGEGRAEAQRLLRERKVPEAVALLQTLVEKFSEDVALADLLRTALETQRAAEETRRNRALIAGRAEAEELAAQRAYPAAIRRYQELLKEYPGDRALAEGLAAVETAQAAEERLHAYSRGRAEAERLAAARSFDAAADCYRALLQQYPRDTALEEGLAAVTAARDAAERKQIYARGRKAVEEALRARNLTEAIQLLEGLQQRFPEEVAIGEDLKNAQALKQEYENKQAYAEGRAAAERLLAALDFQGAIAKYHQLEQQFPNDLFLRDALKAAIAAGEQYRRKREAAQGRGAVERLMQERKVQEAIALLETLVKKFPEDILLADDLRAAVEARDRSQRTLALTTGRREAEELGARRSYEAAIRRYEDLLKEYPGDRLLMEGLAEVKAARAAEERKQAYERARGEAEKLAAARSFDAAIKRYRALLEEYPHDRALEEGLAAAVAAKDAALCKQVYDERRAEAEHLGRQLKFDAAIHVVDELLVLFPHDRALEEQRESLAAAQKSREEGLRIEKQMAQLEKLYRKGDAQGVKDGATSLLAEADTPRLRELIKWADGVLKRKDQPIAVPDTTAPRAHKPWLLLVAAALSLLIVAAVGFLYWNSRRPTPASLAVTPTQIPFTWVEGAAPPGAKNFHVTSGGAWSLTKSDDWLLAQRMPDEQGPDVAVSVAPERLGPGNYSGTVTISGDGATQYVHVSLVVQEPPKPVETATAEPPKVPPAEPPQSKTGSGSKQEAKSEPPAPPKPVAPPADPPVTDQAVDCSKRFGVYHGGLLWNGDLPPGGYVLLGRTLKSVAGAPGIWTGQELPGCEVTITKGTSAAGIAVEPPSAANNFSRLRVRNVSNAPLSSFSLTWDIK